MLRKRLAGLLLTVPLIAGLCFAAYRFGPSPAHPVEPLPVPVIATAKAESNNEENAQVLELFGMYQAAVAKGRVAVTPAEYLNSLETLYLKRGYRKFELPDPNAKAKRTRHARSKEAISGKFFQREDANGIGNISATGEDADHTSTDVAAEPYTFTTLVVPAADGGADWATYRIALDRSKLSQLDQLDHGDFPGVDPVDIPRAPGLQRIYALNSGTTAIAIYKSNISDNVLMLRYLDEMPRSGWTLDSAATSAANKVATGVMSFTRGSRSCLIWITPGKDPQTTNVTISSH